MAYDADENNATALYSSVMWKMYTTSETHESERGKVFKYPRPMMVQLRDPQQRVLFNVPIRRPNPVFHLMEAIWMLAGDNKVSFLLDFNKTYADFAEPEGHVHGAYGHRWRHTFADDQLLAIWELLSFAPNTRRAVLQMWDADRDLGNYKVKDRPCNTHAYFAINHGYLDMMVCNRSNDILWGMMGANIVHMTMLQEWLAGALGKGLGFYQVVTMNAHLYQNLYTQSIGDLMNEARFLPAHGIKEPATALLGGDGAMDFLDDARRMVNLGDNAEYKTFWFNNVAEPIRQWWTNRTPENLEKVVCPMWTRAIKEWVASSPTASTSQQQSTPAP